jgi:hypothetical protein
MACPVPENFVVYKSAVKQQRHSIILLQKANLLPNELMDPYCAILHYPIITIEFILRHNCLKKCDGTPCKHLLFFEYTGYPEKDIGILYLLGWTKQHKKLVLARTRHRHKYGFTEKFDAHAILYPQVIAEGSKRS